MGNNWSHAGGPNWQLNSCPGKSEVCVSTEAEDVGMWQACLEDSRLNLSAHDNCCWL